MFKLIRSACGFCVCLLALASAPATAKPPAGTDVITYKNDVSRTGQNLTESMLTLTNVASPTFGLLRQLPVDGKVDAQPLYLSALRVAGAHHNVVFVATEGDSVYALDADSGATLWHVSLLESGETPSDPLGCSQVTPQIGVTSTPVIDRTAGAHGAIYLVAMSKDTSGNYYQRLHALDITTGAELARSPATIEAAYPTAEGGSTRFNPKQYEERAALLLINKTIFTTWTSHCDDRPYTGWIMAFSQATLARSAVLNVGANGHGSGPGIWMGGGGPAADTSGNVYLLTGNGPFEVNLNAEGFPLRQDYGNSFLKLATAGNKLTVADYFAMSNEVTESAADDDLGSSEGMLLPDLTDSGGVVRHLIVGAGKDGSIYVVNRDSMGKFSPDGNNIWQWLNDVVPNGVHSTPAYFERTVYYGENSASLKAFSVTDAMLSDAPISQTATQYTYPGTAPAVSANGTANAIVWAYENTTPAVLHAYDAADLSHELYNSNQAPGNRDQFGAGNKFMVPAIADGKVFVGTPSSVAVFGLLP